jgi:hypothetical protein
MGLDNSKPEKLTQESRSQRDAAKADMVRQRKQDIESFQHQVLSQQSNSSALVEVKEMHLFLSATEKAKAQLDRNGDPLVKADLIAIAIALDQTLIARMSELENMRVSDLNALIRSIIYDPKRLARTPAQSVAPAKHARLT